MIWRAWHNFSIKAGLQLYKNVITTHTVVFMRLKIEFLGQREDLIILLQESLAVFKLVEIIGL